MAVELSEVVRKRLSDATYWHLATLNADGTPQCSPMWVDLRDARILINTATSHLKCSNMRRNPNVALSNTAVDNPHDHIQIRGKIAAVIDGDAADRDINSLAKKYMGVDVYPYRGPGEERVTFLIQLTHVRHFVP